MFWFLSENFSVSYNYDLGLVASCDLGPGSEMLYFL